MSLHQPFQNRTIPLTFRNANICMHQYVFTSALSFSLFVGEWACPSRFTEYCHPHNHCKRTLITCLSCPSRCIDPLHFYNHCKRTIIPRKSPSLLPFNERSVGFASALSHENRQHPCLLMNALLVSHPCETLGVQLRASMPALEKRGEVLLHGQAEPTMVVIAPPPHHQ